MANGDPRGPLQATWTAPVSPEPTEFIKFIKKFHKVKSNEARGREVQKTAAAITNQRNTCCVTELLKTLSTQTKEDKRGVCFEKIVKGFCH